MDGPIWATSACRQVILYDVMDIVQVRNIYGHVLAVHSKFAVRWLFGSSVLARLHKSSLIFACWR